MYDPELIAKFYRKSPKSEVFTELIKDIDVNSSFIIVKRLSDIIPKGITISDKLMVRILIKQHLYRKDRNRLRVRSANGFLFS